MSERKSGGGHRADFPDPPKRGNDAGGSGGPSSSKGCGCGVAMAIFCVLFMLFVLLALFGGMGSVSSIADSTVQRTALPAGSAVETDYYVDEDGSWITNPSKLTSGMREFFQETGVQPYLCILPNGSSTSASELSSLAQERYADLFEDDAHFLLVFCDDDEGSYHCGYWMGSSARTVLDDEALEIFAGYLSQNYNDLSLSEDELFSNTYRQTAERIMQVTTSPVVYVSVAVAVVVVALVAFVLLRRKQQRKREESERMERIMNTPLDKFGDKDVEDLAKKYEEK